MLKHNLRSCESCCNCEVRARKVQALMRGPYSERINSMPTAKKVRVAALGDLHYGKTSQGSLQSLLAQVSQAADILLICGDLTDYGHPEEAQLLAKELNAGLKIPIVTVLGN